MNWELEQTRMFMAQRLRVALGFSGHTRSSLAARIGVSVNAVSKWTRGAQLPNPTALHDIARETKVSVEWLQEQSPVILEKPETTA